MFDLENGESEYFSQVFNDLDLSEKEVSAKEFEDCTFNECNFSGGVLKNCKFIDCTFSKCNLSNVKVPFTRFTDVIFSECKLIGVDWTRASWSNFDLSSPLKFNQCVINDSSFFALKLAEIVIENCKAHDVDFREGAFSKGCFRYTDFSNSLFDSTDLSEADFTEATAYRIDIYNNIIKGAKFSMHEAVNLLQSLEIELIY